jgi:thymidylate kinase
MFICFVGIDGSGKTLQARKLQESLQQRGVKCNYIWCRYSPRVLMPLIWLAKRLIRKKKGGSDYQGFTSSKKGLFKKPLLGAIWKNVSSLEYLTQVTCTLRPKLRKDSILVCDRYVYDMVADLSINLGRSGEGVVDLLKHPALRRLPTPDKVFFLSVPPDVAFARKDDPNVMGKQYLVDRAEIYDCLSDALGFTRVDGTKSIEEIAEVVLSDTLELIGSRNREERN